MYVPWTTFLRLLICWWKESVVFHIIFNFIVNTARKIAVAKASLLTLSSTLLFHLQNYPTYIVPSSGVHFTLPSRTCEVRTTEDASPKYLVLRNGPGLGGAVAHSPTSPDYLPNHHGTLACDGNADSNMSGEKMFLGQIVPCNFCGKVAYVYTKTFYLINLKLLLQN